MEFPRASDVSPRLERLAHTGSTNDDMVRRATGADASGWPHLSVVVTTDQRSGRGRLGRSWVAPAGSSLAASVLLRIDAVPLESWGWIPLLAGAAMTRAIAAALGDPSRAALKWPNDVLIDDRKVCGILCELLPQQAAVVVGSGVNVSLGAEDLPTDSSTSLTLAGARGADPDRLLAAYLIELVALVERFTAASGDAASSRLRDEVQRLCSTVGRSVRVHLPGGGELRGTAVGLDEFGRLRIESASDAVLTAVAAGDVTHLRY